VVVVYFKAVLFLSHEHLLSEKSVPTPRLEARTFQILVCRNMMDIIMELTLRVAFMPSTCNVGYSSLGILLY
jgi:hypothetical protein